ncbi:rhodanese-like domain-containing protein [Polaribacter sp. Hel1_85]|uniref:rhodanese-like domain-containing protein n=1 Tax=Polaribacter sp. Hel1_85 TaxID=1250005 RepID=UPI00052D6A7F|nr:rhodanese-like domain-containing protein [Polaribacter sp. Hel1_85]KGL62352.1 rhodanese-like protein [Polaribacter sp. Hel1_85]
MVKKRIAKILSFRYVMMAAILVVLAGGLVLLPKYEKSEGIPAEQLLSNIISLERYVSTDQISEKIISQDPSFILIDVRNEKSYNTYTLPNAINIPLKNLLDEKFEAYLNQDQFDILFFSDDNFYADQAWAICNRLEYKNLHVLKGGINKWFTTIINPQKPLENSAAKEFELYTTRKAASMFYGVVYPDQAKIKSVAKKTPRKIITVKKKKKMPTEGGC